MSTEYKIDVRGLGYDDCTLTVKASSLREAKRYEREAKVRWCELNNIDLDDNFEMPFTRTTKVCKS